MIIRHVDEVVGTERDVRGAGWNSRRIVVAADDVGYSVHETILDPGAGLRFRYRAHRETVYCIEGTGTVEDLDTGRTVDLRPGGLYSAGIGEEHVITAGSRMRLLCIFTPALHGTEEAD